MLLMDCLFTTLRRVNASYYFMVNVPNLGVASAPSPSPVSLCPKPQPSLVRNIFRIKLIFPFPR